MEKNSLYETVKQVMQKYPETINDEFLLYLKVCESLGIKTGKSLRKLCKYHSKQNMPMFTTVSRHHYQVLKDGFNK